MLRKILNSFRSGIWHKEEVTFALNCFIFVLHYHIDVIETLTMKCILSVCDINFSYIIFLDSAIMTVDADAHVYHLLLSLQDIRLCICGLCDESMAFDVYYDPFINT